MNWQSSKREIADLEPRDQPRQRDLRRIASAAEHALAEKGAAELHAIDSADQVAAVPDFDRMGVARAVQREHRALDLGVDPGFVALGAADDHAGEIAVLGDCEPAERMVRRSERERWKPSSGMIARWRGSTQNSSSASRLSAIGKMPVA